MSRMITIPVANDYNLSRLKKKNLTECSKLLGFNLDEFVNGNAKNEVPDEKPGLIDSDEKQFLADENSANGNEVLSKKFIDDNDSDTDSMVGVQDHCSSEESGFDYIETRFGKLVLPQETNPLSTEIPMSTYDKDQSVGFISMLQRDGDDGAGRKDSVSKKNTLCRDMPNNCNFNPQQNVFELTQKLYSEDADYYNGIANGLQECYNQRHPPDSDCVCEERQRYIELHTNQIIATTPFKWTDDQDFCVKALYFHSKLCEFGDNCKVPYCKDLRNASPGFEDNSILDFGEILCVFFQKEQFIPVASNSEQIISNQLQIQCAKKIGSGAFASVYEAWLRVNNKDARVAIRKMKLSENVDVKSQTIRNYQNLRELLVQDCPYIVTPDIILVSDKYFISIMQCEVTSLSAYIEKKRQEHCQNDNCNEFIHLQCNKVSRQYVFVWLLQITRGVEFLHQNGRIHGDLKPENVLMTCNGTLKICDLDSVKVLNDGSASTHVTGTYGYADPDIYEIFKSMNFTSDVYSLATFIPAIFGLSDMYLSVSTLEASSILTRRRNDMFCEVMMQFTHLFPFSALFRWVVKSTGDDKPNITQIVKLFTEHEQFEMFRTSTQPCVTDHLHQGFLMNENPGSHLFRKWIMNQLDDGLIPTANPTTASDIA